MKQKLLSKTVLTIKHFIREHFPEYNQEENKELTREFYRRTIFLKETNSKKIFENYYKPKAITEILKKDNYLTTDSPQLTFKASALMFEDLANGVIDEFYLPREKE